MSTGRRAPRGGRVPAEEGGRLRGPEPEQGDGPTLPGVVMGEQVAPGDQQGKTVGIRGDGFPSIRGTTVTNVERKKTRINPVG